MRPRPNLVALASILLVWCSSEVWGAPTEALLVPNAGLKMPLRVRSPMSGRSVQERGVLAKRQREVAMAKYARQPNQMRKRSEGYNLLVDQERDSGYYGSLAIGTPATSFNVVIDTGSSDLWVVGTSCGTACKGLAEFNPSSSSSFKNLSSSFVITYGQGEAAGYVGQDVVQMAGFTVDNQGFSVVDELSSDLLLAPVSGIMGFAWEPLSASQQMPFWQTLASSSGVLDSSLFAVQLRRYSNASNPSSLEPGGELTIGYANSSLYTGSIDYIDIPGTPSYWYLTISSLTVQGNAISLGSDTTAAIDTGTTNIGGPSSAIEAIYAQIPNSSVGSGEWEGYYQYPCSTTVSVEISFGGNNWTMSSADFQYTSISSSECIGAFFVSSTSTQSNSGAPSWIIGDAFLKNVYSVFRYNPASIGFAALSEVAIAENGVNGAVPSATIGSNSATVTSTSGAMLRIRGRHGSILGAISLFVTMVLLVI